ncbi:MAG TPA: rhodanese-like domain-containing protein [Solirubrobacteraceae bacterium]|jgi:rhodanese-related sulfurtransferase
MTTVREMVDDAKSRIDNLSIEEVEAERREGKALLIDVRDVRELWREGKIPGARHVPRGMLEFWADPESEYYKDFMKPDARVVLYCAGGLRSALAADALNRLGYSDVAHLEAGFDEWKRRGGEVDEVPQKR